MRESKRRARRIIGCIMGHKIGGAYLANLSILAKMPSLGQNVPTRRKSNGRKNTQFPNQKQQNNMDIVIWRKYRKAEYTIGRMYIDGVYFCNTLEDTDRGLMQSMTAGEILNTKIAGKTAIPVGNYKLTRSYSPRFKRLMPQVMNVKGFAGVRIHSGNTAKDTEGCPLVGDNTIKGALTNSRKRYTEFDTKLQIAGGTADLHIVWDYDEGAEK